MTTLLERTDDPVLAPDRQRRLVVIGNGMAGARAVEEILARGGVTSPEQLRRIADVAEKYAVPMVKLTGGQRIDLLGIKKEDLPAVWSDLGMPSGYAYGKSFRTVKTCVGQEFCRFGTGDSTSWGSRSRPGCRAWRARPR